MLPQDEIFHFYDNMKALPGSDGQRMSETDLRARIALFESMLVEAGRSEERFQLRSEIDILRMVLGERRRNPTTNRGMRTIGEEAYDWTIDLTIVRRQATERK